ncbi:PAS domain S-box protein [Pelosinus sp. sgz500959]|uniref:SpoIIE family protein phosphatase n=1 Tax=Pelosinus sp. sgz500959 TaxID=3242472 RepID=UPI0036727AF9
MTETHETLQKFQLFFLHSRDIMLFVDKENGNIIEANPAAEKAYGYLRDELLNKHILDLRIEREVGLTIEQMNVAVQDSIIFNTVHKRKNGSLFPVQVSSRSEQVGERHILFSVVRDITEQDKAEKALQKLNIELESNVAERTRELEDMNAILEEEIVERTKAENDLRQREEELRILTIALEEKVEERTRELQDINAILEEEVMERQAVQEELLESRERYEALMKQSSDAIIVIRLDTNEIIDVNYAFSAMFGYTGIEVVGKKITQFSLINHEDLKMIKVKSLENDYIESDIRYYLRKDGRVIYAERTGSLIHHRGDYLLLLSYRDITEQQKLQAEIKKQVELAATVQKSLLLPDRQYEQLSIRTIFQPLTMVSGDFYNYRWSADRKILYGYLIDVTGHGVATALHTSAVSSLLNEVMENEQVWTVEILTRLNNYLYDYFQDHSFVAFMGFWLNLEDKKLTCISGGINYLLACTREQSSVLTIRGSYLGVSKIPEFSTMTLPVQHGDTFYFMTDGISEMLPKEFSEKIYQFDDSVQGLQQLALMRTRHDDCTAICMQFIDKKPFPLFFYFSRQNDHHKIRSRINWIVNQLTFEKQSKIGLALGEAITNAIEHGIHIRVKINQFGDRLVLRVKDDGKGFKGNERIKEILAIGLEQIFQVVLYNERGRGIPIILNWCDRVLYNRRGNEILLLKRICHSK